MMVMIPIDTSWTSSAAGQASVARMPTVTYAAQPVVLTSGWVARKFAHLVSVRVRTSAVR